MGMVRLVLHLVQHRGKYFNALKTLASDAHTSFWDDIAVHVRGASQTSSPHKQILKLGADTSSFTPLT